MENKNWKGVWWFPDNPDKTMHGTLEYSIHEGGVLEFSETEDDFIKLFDHDKLIFEIIHGVEFSGKKITLFNSVLSHRQFGFTCITIKKFLVSVIFEGVHYKNIDEISFNAMEFYITNLWDWAQLSGFTKTVEFDKNNRPDKFNIEYKLQDTVKVKINDSDYLSLQSSTSLPTHYSSNITLVETTTAKIESDRYYTFHEFYKKGFILNAFISLGLSVPTFIRNMKGYSNNLFITLENGKTFPEEINIYYRSFYPVSKEDKIDNDNVLFYYKTIKDDLAELLYGWYNKFHEYESALDLFFHATSLPNISNDQKFMYLVESFESLHRNYYGGFYIEKNKYLDGLYNKFLSVFPDDLDKDFKESLKIKLQYMSEYSLSKRIKAFLSSYNDIFQLEKDAINNLASRISKTRNYYAHRDMELKKEAMQGKELLNGIQVLLKMLRITILEIVGFKKDKITQFFNK